MILLCFFTQFFYTEFEQMTPKDQLPFTAKLLYQHILKGLPFEQVDNNTIELATIRRFKTIVKVPFIA